MDNLYLVLADLVIVANRQTKQRTDDNDNPNPNANKMIVTCVDTLTGKTHSVMWTDDQLSNVVACAISNGGEGFCKEQYDVANEACEGFPQECRPIP